MVVDPLLKVPCHTDCKTSNKKQESSNTVMIITAWWTKWTKAVLQAPCLSLLQDGVRASILRRTLADFHKDNRSTGTFSGRGVCACMQGQSVETWIYLTSSKLKKANTEFKEPELLNGSTKLKKLNFQEGLWSKMALKAHSRDKLGSGKSGLAALLAVC